MNSAPDPDAIPEELNCRAQWVCWRWVVRDGKRTKVPIDPESGLEASVKDPSTWGTVSEAVTRPEDGIGFVFTEGDPFCGVDLDGVLDPETGEIEPRASEIIVNLDSYTERSPSGRGVHVIVRGALPGSRNRKDRIEMYDHERFFTVTGQPVLAAPVGVEERQGALTAPTTTFSATLQRTTSCRSLSHAR